MISLIDGRERKILRSRFDQCLLIFFSQRFKSRNQFRVNTALELNALVQVSKHSIAVVDIRLKHVGFGKGNGDSQIVGPQLAGFSCN